MEGMKEIRIIIRQSRRPTICFKDHSPILRNIGAVPKKMSRMSELAEHIMHPDGQRWIWGICLWIWLTAKLLETKLTRKDLYLLGIGISLNHFLKTTWLFVKELPQDLYKGFNCKSVEWVKGPKPRIVTMPKTDGGEEIRKIGLLIAFKSFRLRHRSNPKLPERHPCFIIHTPWPSR